MIDELNQKMCEFALARLHAMGETESGLYNYYAYLAKKGTMLRPEELAVAEYIDRWVPRHMRILEMCAGAAQLGHLLSLMGYRVSAVEIDPRRSVFAAALGGYVGSRCSVMLGEWQALDLSQWRVLVTINAATSHIVPTDTELLRSHAARGGDVIIRPRQFGAAGIAEEIPGLRGMPITEDIRHYAR